jgi:hypothetical protein
MPQSHTHTVRLRTCAPDVLAQLGLAGIQLPLHLALHQAAACTANWNVLMDNQGLSVMCATVLRSLLPLHP